MNAEIIVHAIGGRIPLKYPDLDAYILSLCEWYDSVSGQIDVSHDDRLITLSFVHYDCDDCDSSSIIIKDEVPDCVDVADMILQIKACC